MENIPSLRELHSRLDALPLPEGESVTPQQQLDALEEHCIQVLDGSWELYASIEADEYVPGVLEEFLQTYLYLRRLELGLMYPDADHT
jgi:hypothetical protein